MFENGVKKYSNMNKITAKLIYQSLAILFEPKSELQIISIAPNTLPLDGECPDDGDGTVSTKAYHLFLQFSDLLSYYNHLKK